MKKRFTYSWKKRYTGQRILILLTGLLFGLHLLQATDNSGFFWQDNAKVITGTVTDGNTKEPLPGVSILIQGTSKGTITDIDGKYTIEASEADILIFSYIGYLEEQVKVGTQVEINISLEPDIVGLDEVVVVGYGVQQKKLTTGATVQVKSEEITNSNTTRLESSLQGLTPGMVIVKKSGQPGSDYNINIRGLGSVNGSAPLVLIDGVPGNINSVNPNDVETVDVLKDAASAAIYGSRAADGVILITTKKGKSGEAKVSYDFHYGISNPVRLVSMLGAQDYAMLQNEIATNNNAKLQFRQSYIDSLGTGTDWQKEALTKNAASQSHYIGINGGSEKSAYSISLSYDKEEGIFNYDNKSNYERFGIRINTEHKLKKYLTIGENISYYHRNTTGLGVTNIYDNFIRSLLLAEPIMQAYDDSEDDGFGRSAYRPLDVINPLATMHYNYNGKNHNDNFTGNMFAEIEPIEGLKIRTDFGGLLYFQNNTTVNDTFTYHRQTFYRTIAEYKQYMGRDFSYNWDNVISYNKKIGNHSLTILAGTNTQDNWKFNIDASMNGYLSNPNLPPVLSNVVALQPTVKNDTVNLKGDYGKTDGRFSIFGRIFYNYNEKYLFTFSLRRDGSSRFGPSYRYGYFPAVSAGWVISQESFMENNTWLNFLKVRASWGKNGKEPNVAGRFLATVGSENRGYTFGSSKNIGMSPNILPNPDLKWESSIQTNIGFDSRFLKDFSLNFDWYKKTSGDWIVPTTVPGITGMSGISTTNPYINGGDVVNTGFEIQLGYFKSVSDLSLNIQVNMAYNKNEVTSVPGKIIRGSSSVLYNGSDEFYRVQEDYPLGYFYGYKTDGLFQTQEEIDNYIGLGGEPMQGKAKPGDVKRIDLNGDSVLTDDGDKTLIGNPFPDFVYGINIGASYKGIDFSVNIAGQAGNQVVKCYGDYTRTFYNSTTEMLDRWQWNDINNDGIVDAGEGVGNTIPRVTGGSDANRNWRSFSDLYIYDAGFLRFKSVNLGYDFKKTFANLPVQKFRLYVSATNLLTITKYNGFDPEVGYGSSYNSQGMLVDAYASGVDLGFYPTPRTYLVGINVEF